MIEQTLGLEPNAKRFDGDTDLATQSPPGRSSGRASIYIYIDMYSGQATSDGQSSQVGSDLGSPGRQGLSYIGGGGASFLGGYRGP